MERKALRETDAALDALLAPHRAFTEGRAALETLDGDKIARAREVFEGALRAAPDHASAHIGLANACVMRFETTRADPAPDVAALGEAAVHAREACRLDPGSGEAWATLGFVLDRTGDRVDALAASKRAVTLEPDNWRHHFRLAYVGWGEERLRAADRTLALLPEFPLARWLAATVHVARQVPNEAERELSAALASEVRPASADARFGSLALHWLFGLILLARGDQRRALDEFERELASENSGHLYGRECAANTWYAIGALKLRQGRHEEAQGAFRRALDRVATHPMARLGLEGERASWPGRRAATVDAAIFHAAQLAMVGKHAEAANIVEQALAGAPPGNAGWLLPVEPLLQVTSHPEIWARPLAQLRNRAA